MSDLGFTSSLPGRRVGAETQYLAEKRTAERNQRLMEQGMDATRARTEEAGGALQQGLGLLQSYRPGGAAALASGSYSQMANMIYGQGGREADIYSAMRTEAPDLMFRYREHQRKSANRRAKRARIMGLVGTAIGAAATIATGGAAAPLMAMGGAAAAGAAGGGAVGGAVGASPGAFNWGKGLAAGAQFLGEGLQRQSGMGGAQGQAEAQAAIGQAGITPLAPQGGQGVGGGPGGSGTPGAPGAPAIAGAAAGEAAGQAAGQAIITPPQGGGGGGGGLGGGGAAPLGTGGGDIGGFGAGGGGISGAGGGGILPGGGAGGPLNTAGDLAQMGMDMSQGTGHPGRAWTDNAGLAATGEELGDPNANLNFALKGIEDDHESQWAHDLNDYIDGFMGVRAMGMHLGSEAYSSDGAQRYAVDYQLSDDGYRVSGNPVETMPFREPPADVLENNPIMERSDYEVLPSTSYYSHPKELRK